MPCFYPLQAWRSSGGKKKDGTWPVVFDSANGILSEELKIPCGQCKGCRMDRSKAWAARCVVEASLYNKNCFLTLTYNDDKLVEHCGIYEEDTGCILDYSLNKKDFVNFMRRLRDNYATEKIRFFHCGEYGSRLGRPHHHVCLFGFDFQDKQVWDVRDNVVLWRSKELERIWPYGFSTIGEVTPESAAYISRYVLKKVNGDLAEGHYNGRQPEYITMSRKPGIAKDWYDKFSSDVTSIDRLHATRELHCKTPKYFDKLYEIKEGKEALTKVKEKRMKRVNHYNNTPERLKIRERILEHRIKKLVRKLEG